MTTFSGIVVFIMMMLSMTGCASWSNDKGSLAANEHSLSASEFSRVKAAIHLLPEPLLRALDHHEMYRSVTGAMPFLSNAKSQIIQLRSESLSSSAVDDKALQREILLPFFKYHAGHLDLFCEGATTCHDLADKEKQFMNFFRGSYLQRVSSQDGASNDDRLSDVYAFHATEYFVDNTYRCKHPLSTKVLESIWDFNSGVRNCNDLVPFLVSESEKPNEIRWVDPSRIYAVHLLFAGAAGSSMSRFGHVTLRIIQCNKDRFVVDQQCEQDLFDHISLGFKANIDELDLSIWKGITGGYALKLYAKTFMDTYSEYSIDEFRDVYSLPLVLSELDKSFLVAALSEIHWSYQNDYRFFTQNCATEMQWLLNSIFYAQHSSAKPFFLESRYRPDRLFDDAKESNHFNTAALSSLSDAEKKGYYFPSTEKYYQLALDAVAVQLSPSEKMIARTPQEWMNQDALFRREHWLRPALKGKNIEGVKYTVHAKMVLEGWVARKLRREILASLMFYYGKIFQAVTEDKTLLNESENKLLLNCLNEIKTADTAGTNADGIPEGSLAIDSSSACDINNAELASLMKKLFDTFPVSASQRKNISELMDTVENIVIIQTPLLK